MNRTVDLGAAQDPGSVAVAWAAAAHAVTGRRLRQSTVAAVRHLVDVAAAAPAIKILWFERWSCAATALGRLGLGGLAYFDAGAPMVIAPTPTDLADLAIVAHEIGHHRAPDGFAGDRQGERAAWAWALAQMRVWDLACHHSLTLALRDDPEGYSALEHASAIRVCRQTRDPADAAEVVQPSDRRRCHSAGEFETWRGPVSVPVCTPCRAWLDTVRRPLESWHAAAGQAAATKGRDRDAALWRVGAVRR